MPARFSTSSKLASTVIRRLKGAARKEQWGGAFIKLAWTAGPVTYLALQGGYYIAYGETASPLIVLYFGAYTMVAGIFALATKFAYNATKGSTMEEDMKVLESTFDALPRRIVEIRNLQLRSMDSLSRNVLSAKYLLENPQAGSDAVALAVRDITGDLELVQEMTALEVYRGNGLYYKAGEKSREILRLLEPHMENLNRISENVGRMIRERAAGEPDEKAYGRRRTAGFISRVLQASENDNLDYMTLQDAEEVCILVFELLNSRAFPHYTTEYKGNKQYREAAQRLSRARRDYRKHIYRRNSAIRILAEELYKEKQDRRSGKAPEHLSPRSPGKKRKGIQRLLATIPQIRSARTLQHRITESVREMARTNPSPQNGEWRRIQSLYRNLYRNSQSVEKAYRKFLKIWQDMQTLIDRQAENGIFDESAPHRGNSKYSRKSPIRLVGGETKKTGIRIRPSQVFLTNKKILPVARMVYEKLEEFDTAHENINIKINDQKELAIDLLHILDQYLPLEQTHVQRAIELTGSAYISRNNRQEKTGGSHNWSLSLVEEEEFPGKPSLHDMVESLVKYEYLELDKEDHRYLEETYGADPDFLDSLIREERRRESRSFPIEAPELVPPLETLCL